jgi:hypothetical protein
MSVGRVGASIRKWIKTDTAASLASQALGTTRSLSPEKNESPSKFSEVGE